MADTIVVTCPNCKKQMKAAAEALGKKVRCKACGAAVPVKAASAKAGGAKKAPAAKKSEGAKPADKAAIKNPGFDADTNPYGVEAIDDIPRCPTCAKEMESAEAIICLHCGYNTATRTYMEVTRTYGNTGGEQFMWLLPGFLCIVLIILMIFFDFWFWFGLKEMWFAWDDNVKGISYGARVWVVMITVWIGWKVGNFAFKRLVIDTKRPEKEKE